MEPSKVTKVLIGYEPVWAIGGEQAMSPRDMHEMAIFIRKILSDKFGKDASRVRVLYGGSVNEKDCAEFLQHGAVEGLLVGKSSLDAEKFIEIVKICEASNQ